MVAYLAAGAPNDSTSRSSNYIFESGNTYFHSNNYPRMQFSEMVHSIKFSFDLAPINEFMLVRLQVNNGNTGPYSNYRIGATAEGNHYSSSLDVSEIIAFDSVISDQDAGIVERYLLDKWGIQGTVSSSTQYLYDGVDVIGGQIYVAGKLTTDQA